jgi:hypothetical protein
MALGSVIAHGPRKGPKRACDVLGSGLIGCVLLTPRGDDEACWGGRIQGSRLGGLGRTRPLTTQPRSAPKRALRPSLARFLAPKSSVAGVYGARSGVYGARSSGPAAPAKVAWPRKFRGEGDAWGPHGDEPPPVLRHTWSGLKGFTGEHPPPLSTQGYTSAMAAIEHLLPDMVLALNHQVWFNRQPSTPPLVTNPGPSGLALPGPFRSCHPQKGACVCTRVWQVVRLWLGGWAGRLGGEGEK